MDTKQKHREQNPENTRQQRRAPADRQSQSGKVPVKQRPQESGKNRQPARQSQKAPVRRQRSSSQEEVYRTDRPRRLPAEPEPETLGSKKRAYGNSKPKKKSALAAAGDVFQRSAQRARARKEKQEQKPRQQPQPAVIYTQPKAFNRSKLIVQLITVTAVVLALVMGLAVFFKVETITVAGAEVYSEKSIEEASGITVGDNLLTFSRARAGALIMANLPYVKNVSFGIKLPGTVNIIVVEEDVLYAIQDVNEQWWLINSEGRIVEQTNAGKAANYTQVVGVQIQGPELGEKATAAEDIPMSTDAEGETIPAVTITGSQRLIAALEILQALEENDIVGDAASVNVSRLEEIMLWYGTRYQVNLGDSTRLDYKVACMNDVILRLSDYQSGILDISFRVWTDRVIYTPFS